MLFCRAAAEFPEDKGADGEVEEGAREEAEEDHDGDGVEDFATGLAGAEEERDEGESGGEGGHEHGDDSFLGAADDHLLVEAFALLAHQVEVVGNHHDSVAGGDAGEGDEADHRGDGDGAVGEKPDADYGSNEGEGNIQHDLEGEIDAAKLEIKDKEHPGEACQPKEQEEARGTGLAFELPAVGNEIAGGKLDRGGDFLACLLDGSDEVASGDIGGDISPALAVLTVHHVRPHRLLHIGHKPERHDAAIQGIDGDLADRFDIAPRGVWEAEGDIVGALAL